MRRSWLKASRAKDIMKLGASCMIITWPLALYFYVMGAASVPSLYVALLVLLGAVGGPIMFVYGLLAYLYHRTGRKDEQLSILVLKGPEAGRVEVFKASIRVGVAATGHPMISQSAFDPPDQYWLLTHEKGQWKIQHVAGTLTAHVNGNPVGEGETLEPGDRIRVGDIYMSFDSFRNNRALMP